VILTHLVDFDVTNHAICASLAIVTPSIDNLPDDLESLKRLLAVERAARIDAETKAASAEAAAAWATAHVSSAEALIAHLKLAIEKMRRELYGSRSERRRKLLDQMELELEDREAAAAEDEIAAEKATAEAGGAVTLVPAHARRKPVRKPFPPHLPRERVLVPGPTACACCGSTRLSKLGEDITETLEVIPRQWKVIQHVREKFTCRTCEKISQAPAPFHVIARGRAGPSLLAMILYAKFALHQPLNRQSEAYAHEGVDLPLSTLADDVGASAAVLAPLAPMSAMIIL
jgi:transposase